MASFLDAYLSQPCLPGDRNRGLFVSVLCAREEGWSEPDIRARLGAKARQDGLGQREVDTTIASAMRRPISPREREHYRQSGGVPLSWGSTIGGNVAVDTPPPIPSPAPDWERTDLARFLQAVFRPGEMVSYVVEASNHEGSVRPVGRGVQRPLESLLEYAADNPACDVVYSSEAGAWTRLNPTDGKGIGDANVTEYRHALVESDSLSVEQQWAVLERLRVPCSTVVHSGGKSLHAAVRVDAGRDLSLYRKRVERLYAVLENAGLHVDKQNRNPSRLSRLPGVLRAGRPQYLVATQIGCPSWAEWEAHLEDDGLPPIENAGVVLRDPPPLAPEVIRGILRRGHKMLLSGPSKSGKSFAMIQLACAVSSGGAWFGYDCATGRVLYINLEIDRASFLRRLQDVAERIPAKLDSIDTWSLRGHAMELNALTLRLVKRIQHEAYTLIIVDPIYKTLTGDENSARDMAAFCNWLDVIAKHAAAAVAFSSHFSKGVQGHKSSIDRTSGSGVFGRDPDAIGTLTEMELRGQEDISGYWLEWTLREFPSAARTPLAWEWPLHRIEPTLGDRKAKGSPGAPPKASFTQIEEMADFNGGQIELAVLAKALRVSVKTIQRRMAAPPPNLVLEGRIIKLVRGEEPSED